ncbi:MAG TPA: hypothetical protein VHE55_16195 [Fimbriimonadaceae bacterium]|nr:hypothetical protein [Fimbriimonadaceae bacterium]
MPLDAADEKRLDKLESKLEDTCKETQSLKGYAQAVGLVFTVAALIMAVLGILGINKINDRDAMAQLKPQISILLTDAMKTRLTEAINQISINASTDAAKEKTHELLNTEHLLDQLQPDDQVYDLMKQITSAIKSYVVDRKVDEAEKEATQVQALSIGQHFIHPRAAALLASLQLYKKQEFFSDDSIRQLLEALQEDGSISMLHNVLAIELVNRSNARYAQRQLSDANRDLRDAIDHFQRVQMLDSSNEGHYKVLNNVAWAELNGLDSSRKVQTSALAEYFATFDSADPGVFFKRIEGDLQLAETLQPDQPTAYETSAEMLCMRYLVGSKSANDLVLAEREFVRSIQRGFFDNAQQWPSSASAKDWYRKADPLLAALAQDQMLLASIDHEIEAYFAQHPRS